MNDTRYGYEMLAVYRENQEDLPGKEYIQQFNEERQFVKKLKQSVLKYDPTADVSEVKTISKFLQKICVNELSISRQTLNNWLEDGFPSKTEGGRENVFKLCFALQMTLEETEEFFVKACYEYPFNFKRLEDSVYYFCLKTKKDYKYAQDMITMLENEPVVDNPVAESITENLRYYITQIDTEEAFLQYIRENRCGFTERNKTAVREVVRLLDRCLNDFGIKKAGLTGYLEKKKTDNRAMKNEEELCEFMYGYRRRSQVDGRRLYEEKENSMKNASLFPRMIFENFPEPKCLQDIRKVKEAHDGLQNLKNPNANIYDSTRKALIMLSFFHFFTEYEVVRGKIDVDEEVTEEFIDELNERLDACGYARLYSRHPFDWMIMYCASRQDPVLELQELIDELYLNVVEPVVIPEDDKASK